jgi:hypothetical protein
VPPDPEDDRTVNLHNPFKTDRSPALNGAGPDHLPAPEGNGLTGKVLRAAVERALEVQGPLVAAHIAKVRREDPSATPAEVIRTLDKQYQMAVAGTGAAAGGFAVVPAIGTVVSLATATAEAIAALDASVLYTLAVAEVYGLGLDDIERRRALVLGIVLGDGGAKLMKKVTGGSNQWAQGLADAVPLPKLGPVNQTLVRWFIRRFAIRQGALAFGRALPLGAGVVVGAAGNLATAKGVINSAQRAFGPPPTAWPA